MPAAGSPRSSAHNGFEFEAELSDTDPLFTLFAICTGLAVSISLNSVVDVFADVQYSLGLPH